MAKTVNPLTSVKAEAKKLESKLATKERQESKLNDKYAPKVAALDGKIAALIAQRDDLEDERAAALEEIQEAKGELQAELERLRAQLDAAGETTAPKAGLRVRKDVTWTLAGIALPKTLCGFLIARLESGKAKDGSIKGDKVSDLLEVLANGKEVEGEKDTWRLECQGRKGYTFRLDGDRLVFTRDE